MYRGQRGPLDRFFQPRSSGGHRDAVRPIVRQDLKGGPAPGFQGLLYAQGPVFDLNVAGGDLGVQAVLDAAGGIVILQAHKSLGRRGERAFDRGLRGGGLEAPREIVHCAARVWTAAAH